MTSILQHIARSLVDLALAAVICGAIFVGVVVFYDHLVPALCRLAALTC